MKDFFKYTLATMLGMFIMGAFTMAMGFVMLLVVSISDSMKPTVAKHSVLQITLSGPYNNLIPIASTSKIVHFYRQ